jgi:hypothetical protein
MNIKLLVVISFLIALLCHLFIFNSFIFVFSISPETPKPKFFFLGPILQQSDVKPGLPKNATEKEGSPALDNFDHEKTALKNIHYEITSSKENPFTIKTIRKPLVPRTIEEQEKILIKSTFQLPSEEKGVNIEDSNKDLNIQPYQPLRPRLP